MQYFIMSRPVLPSRCSATFLFLMYRVNRLKYSHFQEPQKALDQHIIFFEVLLKTFD